MWELSFSSIDRSDLVRDEGSRRACICTLARVTSPPDTPDLVGFCLKDDRLRVMLTGNERKLGHLRGALLRSLKHAVVVPIGSPDLRLLRHRAHVVSVLRHYVAPAPTEPFELPSPLTSGSCGADLLGARRIPGIRLVTGAALPRLRVRDILSWLGLPVVEPIADGEARRLGASRIASAAAFSVCASPGAVDLDRTSPGVVGLDRASPGVVGLDRASITARRLTARICSDAGIPNSEIAHATGITARAARRLAAATPDASLERAVRLRLAIEEAVRRRAMGHPA